MNDNIIYDKLKNVILGKGYEWYDRTYELNIIGVRSYFPIKNKFNDNMYLAWKENDDKFIYRMKCTTLPGTNYLLKPLNRKGTAILKENQYVNAYKLGLHRNKYLALVQRLQPVTVYRDNNKDDEWNLSVVTETGFFGINIHRASLWYRVLKINKYSAGCQAILIKKDFNKMIDLAKKQKNRFSNKFTYTLINEKDLF